VSSDTDILWYGIDRTNREKAIPSEIPKGLADFKAGLAAYDKQHAQLLQYIRTTADDLRGHIVERQACDAYQWALLISTHERDLMTNPRTPGFRAVPAEELERRVFQIFHHLGNWIGDPKAKQVQTEFEQWGTRRFDQGIQLSEIVCAIIILKRHLRQYIRDNGLVDASFPRVEGEYVLPMHLHSLQDLNVRVGEFFDEALYQLARGF
jgi:hypothetical protein